MLVLADDLTGALETGAKFALEGITSLVTTELSLSPRSHANGVEVLVIDTNSRHLSPSDAGRRIHVLAALARRLEVPRLYKKTDSTLRGNIGRELESISAAYGGSPVLYVPAYPEMGRTVSGGRLQVNGISVSETGFAADVLNPIRESHIPTVLGGQTSLPVYSPPVLNADTGIPTGIHVCDGTTDEDILACARIFLERPDLCLAAGPAALAHGIARLVGWPRKNLAHVPSIERCLIVNGSRNEVSVRQMEYALSSGFRRIGPSWVMSEVPACSWIILAQAEEVGNPLQAARQTGRAVREILQHFPADALLIFGGDTARAVVQSVGSPSLLPLAEALPAVPISRMARAGARELYLITKAGGFGPPDIVMELFGRLQRKD